MKSSLIRTGPFLLLLVLLCAGCEENGVSAPERTLDGTWTVTLISYDFPKDTLTAVLTLSENGGNLFGRMTIEKDDLPLQSGSLHYRVGISPDRVVISAYANDLGYVLEGDLDVGWTTFTGLAHRIDGRVLAEDVLYDQLRLTAVRR